MYANSDSSDDYESIWALASVSSRSSGSNIARYAISQLAYEAAEA
jgi:hypothetical protein